MVVANENKLVEYFPDPLPNTSSKAILNGTYCNTDGIHTILTYVIKNNPTGEYPNYPGNDSQYSLWETSINNWLTKHPLACGYSPTIETSTVPVIEIATTTVQ